MASLNHISSLTFFFLLLVLCFHYSCARNLPLNDLSREEPDPDSKVKSKLSESDPDSKVKSTLSTRDPNDVSIQGGLVIPVPICQTHQCREIYPPIYTPPYIYTPPICIPCEPWYGPGPCPCPCEEGMEGFKNESSNKAQEEGEMHGSQPLLSGRSISTADAPMAAMMDGSNDHA